MRGYVLNCSRDLAEWVDVIISKVVFSTVLKYMDSVKDCLSRRWDKYSRGHHWWSKESNGYDGLVGVSWIHRWLSAIGERVHTMSTLDHAE